MRRIITNAAIDAAYLTLCAGLVVGRVVVGGLCRLERYCAHPPV